jgi:chloramphenicol O-acetyltransferase type A
MITVEFTDDLTSFDERAKEEIKNSNSYFDLGLLSRRADFVFISTLPWIPFTGIDHTLSLRREDSIPRISWGKYFTKGKRVLLPFNIQVNHIFIDGLHVGKFYQLIHEEIRRQINISPRTG